MKLIPATKETKEIKKRVNKERKNRRDGIPYDKSFLDFYENFMDRIEYHKRLILKNMKKNND